MYCPGVSDPTDPWASTSPRDPSAPPGYPEPPVYPQPPRFPPAPYSPPAYPPPAYPGHSVSRPATGTNGFAIASMILGILGCVPGGVLPSVIFGFVALRQIRRTGERGRGLAITGLVASGAWVALTLAFVCLGVAGGMIDDPATGDPPPAAPALRPGTCVNDPLKDEPVPVPCDVPHDGEVFAVFDLPDGPWPGRDELRTRAESRCAGRFGRYLGDPGKAAELDFTYLSPRRQSWPEDRAVICIGFDPAGPTTGSLRD